jgi:hypothetical protein
LARSQLDWIDCEESQKLTGNDVTILRRTGHVLFTPGVKQVLQPLAHADDNANVACRTADRSLEAKENAQDTDMVNNTYMNKIDFIKIRLLIRHWDP